MSLVTFEDYKQKYHEVKEKDPMNPELEKIKREYLKGKISKTRAVEKMEELNQTLINN